MLVWNMFAMLLMLFVARQLQQHATIPLYEFLLFLFVQLYSRSTPRSRKVFGTDDVYVLALVKSFRVIF